MRRAPKIAEPMPAQFVADLRPLPDVDEELDWFFNRAEAAMVLPSNFQSGLGPRGGGEPYTTPDDAVEAAHRHRRVLAWLKVIPDSDAGVLQAAYEVRPWPIPLYDALGRLTGVFVRLACALDSWPADRASQQVIEMARAESLAAFGAMGEAGFVSLRRAAEVRFVQAHHAYGAARQKGLGAS